MKTLYDSYVRAIRWASDRIQERGVVAFVTNGYFIDGNAMDGLRACLVNEFTSLFVFNLRGNARTSGETRKAEAGNIFGGGARTPVAITVMVKNPAKTSPAVLRYHDIGDYLSREEKLEIVADAASIGGLTKSGKWTTLVPNSDHDWINQRDPSFDKSLPLSADSPEDSHVFGATSLGLSTNRDSWIYGFSKSRVLQNMSRLADTAQAEATRLHKAFPNSNRAELEACLTMRPSTHTRSPSTATRSRWIQKNSTPSPK